MNDNLIMFTKVFIYSCIEEYESGGIDKDQLDWFGNKIGIHDLPKHYEKWRDNRCFINAQVRNQTERNYENK